LIKQTWACILILSSFSTNCKKFQDIVQFATAQLKIALCLEVERSFKLTEDSTALNSIPFFQFSDTDWSRHLAFVLNMHKQEDALNAKVATTLQTLSQLEQDESSIS